MLSFFQHNKRHILLDPVSTFKASLQVCNNLTKLKQKFGSERFILTVMNYIHIYLQTALSTAYCTVQCILYFAQHTEFPKLVEIYYFFTD